MTTYAVTGSSGQLGRLVIDHLLARGIAPAAVVAIARSPEKVADLAERGVQVREGDYDRPETLDRALSGVDKLLLVSGSEVGRRVTQHTNVVEAATRAGVARILYTSVLRATTSALVLAPEHSATEEVIRSSGLTHTMLRNGWYTENYTDQVATYVAQGVVVHAAGDGRVAAATRADLAEAAAVAMTDDVAGDLVYELGGPSFTMEELADAVTEVTGTTVAARPVTGEELVAALTGVGLDEDTAGFLAAVDANIADGDLDTDEDDLERLLGRPVTSLVDAVRTAREGSRQTV